MDRPSARPSENVQQSGHRLFLSNLCCDMFLKIAMFQIKIKLPKLYETQGQYNNVHC